MSDMDKRTWLFFLILLLSAAGSFAALSCGQGKAPVASYAVAGKIVDPITGYGLPGVTILISSEGQARVLASAANGEWGEGGVTGRVTVSAVKTGWSFTPESCALDAARPTADFLAQPAAAK
ncbi:MAG: hypothetical protein WC632_03490 [Candidatus Margulisiibacteriota bacterium]